MRGWLADLLVLAGVSGILSGVWGLWGLWVMLLVGGVLLIMFGVALELQTRDEEQRTNLAALARPPQDEPG